ncbi:MAG TPA: class I SAM-dependent methyltransferase [Streptosporangiaceae bacterium]|nr:class I SAM-dependent methyltransferase [Streptosporangiaceae bacterium]
MVPNSLTSPPVRPLLDRLFQAAEGDNARRAGLAGRYPDGFAGLSAREQADAYEQLYIPVSPEGGKLLYALVRASRPSTVVEFGTSFGISTIYLAAAVRDNGAGRVVSTELSAAKVAQARANVAEANLADQVTILAGDALETLATLDGPVEFVLLDGWKYLYLPVLRLLEPRLTPGALVLADDSVSMAAQMADYLGYVRDPGHGYLSIAFPESDGLEISCRA